MSPEIKKLKKLEKIQAIIFILHLVYAVLAFFTARAIERNPAVDLYSVLGWVLVGLMCANVPALFVVRKVLMDAIVVRQLNKVWSGDPDPDFDYQEYKNWYGIEL